MPSCSTNTFFVKGDEKELEQFKKKNFTQNGALSFAMAFPEPTHLKGENIIWWRTSVWGTKWDINEDECTVTDKNGLITVKFETAWKPPANWFWRVKSKYPNLSMFIEYRLESSFDTKRYIGEQFKIDDEKDVSVVMTSSQQNKSVLSEQPEQPKQSTDIHSDSSFQKAIQLSLQQYEDDNLKKAIALSMEEHKTYSPQKKNEVEQLKIKIRQAKAKRSEQIRSAFEMYMRSKNK